MMITKRFARGNSPNLTDAPLHLHNNNHNHPLSHIRIDSFRLIIAWLVQAHLRNVALESALGMQPRAAIPVTLLETLV